VKTRCLVLSSSIEGRFWFSQGLRVLGVVEYGMTFKMGHFCTFSGVQGFTVLESRQSAHSPTVQLRDGYVPI